MEFTSTEIGYPQTGFFSEVVTEILKESAELRPFYEHPVSKAGIESAIRAREAFPTNRNLLADVLELQYTGLINSDQVNENLHQTSYKKVLDNIRLLRQTDTFTICTAHQPNLFTGYLYFIYKILHAVKLSAYLKSEFPAANFVPVYYMGSEDADLDELGNVNLNGEKLEWKTSQAGAVGRMNTKGIELLINRIEGELGVQPFGGELVAMLRNAYRPDTDIQTATFRLVHELFAKFGLVILIADQPVLKQQMQKIFRDDLLEHIPARLVTETNTRLSEFIKVQANPRDINLFYLKGTIRNRIEKKGKDYVVVDTPIHFTTAELLKELKEFPERFSPNVILRGIYQEIILPNIAFIGGGSELAYWLELKSLFEYYRVPYPVQVLRNSLLFAEEKWTKKIDTLGFSLEQFFLPETAIMDLLVKRDSTVQVHLTNEIRDAHAFYEYLKKIGTAVDPTLVAHINALEKRMVKQLGTLEKKLLRAEKRKFGDQQRQVEAIREALFPNNSLQERVENFMPYYAKYGPDFLQCVYDSSLILEQKFVVVSICSKVKTIGLSACL